MSQLQVGILQEKPGWQQILSQEGLSFIQCACQSPIRPEDFAVLILNRHLSSSEIRTVKDYLEMGGAILTDARYFQEIQPTLKFQPKRIQYIIPPEEEIFTSVSLVDLYLKGYGNRVMQGSCGKGYFIILPFDANQTILDRRTKRKAFYAATKRLPDEKVSLVNKGEVRKLVINCLRQLYHKRNLPYLHFWYYPHNHQSVFALRIDTDFANLHQMRQTYELLKNNQICASWFVDVKSHLNILDEMAQWQKQGQEIGVHCFEHYVWRSFKRNYENIKKARGLLKENSIESFGFTAPFGVWNENLARVLETLGFSYSSEFSLNYDDFPFYPFIGEKNSVLQVPIHPICIGSFRFAKFSQKEMKDYFARIIDEKYKRREPIFLYYHPKDTNLEVLDFIINRVKEKENLWVTNFGQFVKFWKERKQMHYVPTLENNIINIKSDPSNASFSSFTKEDVAACHFHLISPSGEEFFSPVNSGRIDLSQISWKMLPSPIKFDKRMLKVKKRKWFLVLRDLENWFYQYRLAKVAKILQSHKK